MNQFMHRHTPTLTVFDPRGLSVRAVTCYRAAPLELVQARVTMQSYNPVGLLSRQWDPRLFAAWQQDETVEPNQSTVYSLSGQALHSANVDAGWRTQLNGEMGQLLGSWDGRGSHSRVEYDALVRPSAYFEQPAGADERCRERLHYAGHSLEDRTHNRCGQLTRHDDSAGSQFTPSFSLLGQALEQTRQFLQLLTAPNWPDAVLEEKAYRTTWQYDALGSEVHQIDAVGNLQSWRRNVAGQLVESSLAPPGLSPRILLRKRAYDAFGKVIEEVAGNNVNSRNKYDPASGLLMQLSACKADGTFLQDLHYRYDPVGNVLQIDDHAQPVRYFRNQRVDPTNVFAYDTLYQLISATGREVATATYGPALPVAADANQCVNYRQTYQYDFAGNMQLLSHQGAKAWSLRMSTGQRSNRSLPERNGELPGEAEIVAAFDRAGNLQALQPGQVLVWDLRNQLQRVSPVVRVDGNDDCELYQYDAGGQRIRKVTLRQAANVGHVADVRYLPGLEIRHNSAVAGGEVLHVVSASAGRNNVRLLHWEQGQPAGIAPDQLRFSLGDHLGSSTLELDDQAATLSHESYYPFGGTAWWASSNHLEASYKTIRYSGEERDASGLYYYGLRYYAPWLCRWINPDPSGDVDGFNRYWFVRNSPVGAYDVSGLMMKSSNADRVEASALRRNKLEVVSRGIAGLGETHPDIASKTLKAVELAQIAVKEAIDVVNLVISRNYATEENEIALDTLISGPGGIQSGNTMPELARIYKGIDKHLTAIASDPEMKSLVFVKQLPGVAENKELRAFVNQRDPARRVFIYEQFVQETHKLFYASSLIHELSHHQRTLDFSYIDTEMSALHVPGAEEILDEILASNLSYAAPLTQGVRDKAIFKAIEKYRTGSQTEEFETNFPELMGDSSILSNPLVRERIFTGNADSVTYLAVAFSAKKLSAAVRAGSSSTASSSRRAGTSRAGR